MEREKDREKDRERERERLPITRTTTEGHIGQGFPKLIIHLLYYPHLEWP
jgi:hypothetical protein